MRELHCTGPSRAGRSVVQTTRGREPSFQEKPYPGRFRDGPVAQIGRKLDFVGQRWRTTITMRINRGRPPATYTSFQLQASGPSPPGEHGRVRARPARRAPKASLLAVRAAFRLRSVRCRSLQNTVSSRRRMLLRPRPISTRTQHGRFVRLTGHGVPRAPRIGNPESRSHQAARDDQRERDHRGDPAPARAPLLRRCRPGLQEEIDPVHDISPLSRCAEATARTTPGDRPVSSFTIGEKCRTLSDCTVRDGRRRAACS